MEWDPETNTFSSNGPSARARTSESEIRKLKERVKALEQAVEELQRRL